MKSKQVDFSRVPHNGGTVSVDTSHIQSDTYSYYETAARKDEGKWVHREYWQILDQYKGRDEALVGHRKWANQIRESGLPEVQEDALS
jgi:hypothetical protein